MVNIMRNEDIKILIVEDNDLNLKLFYDLLTIQKYNVCASKEGEGVYELVLQYKPDLLLLDIQLNGISGIDIIKQLKSSPLTKHMPIIAITAFAMKYDEARIREAGCDLYISKPVAIDYFFEAINKFVKHDVLEKI